MKIKFAILINKSLLIVTIVLSTLVFSQTSTKVGTSKNWGSIDGISMIGLVQETIISRCSTTG